MIEYAQERYEWVPGPREFRRVEDTDTLLDLRPLAADVSRQRHAEGWHLIVSTPLQENAQLYLVDLWARISPPVSETHRAALGGNQGESVEGGLLDRHA